MAEKDRDTMKDAALLVIDVQDSFKVGPRWEWRSNHSFESNVERLVSAFRDAGRPVIFVLHSDSDSPFHVNSPHYRLMDFLRPLPGEPVIHKTTRNCFTSTNLQPLLLKEGVRRVVITGIQTEQCCETTARVAADLGFDVDFVTEATLTFPIPLNADGSGPELSTDAIVERTEYALRRRFARIARVDDVVDALKVTSPA
jgi:nicotinamidase-related amidase